MILCSQWRWLVALAVAPCAAFMKYPEEWIDIKTEPSFKAARVEIHFYPEAGQPSDEYLVTSLHHRWSTGPQINEMEKGQLIFYADPLTSGLGWQDTHLCAYYKNETSHPEHLCASYVVEEMNAHRHSIPKVFDSSYQEVSLSYAGIGNHGIVEAHEFNMFANLGTYVSTIYQPKQVEYLNMTGADPEKTKWSWVYDGCFQEIDAWNRSVLLDWCTLDHMNMGESVVSRNGRAFPFPEDSPLDFAHINSVDKDAAEDYIVSLKSFDVLLKIAGPYSKLGAPGEILWRLGGKLSNFTFDPPESQFHTQHHVRWVTGRFNGSRTMVSLFDNECLDDERCPYHTSGKIFELDEENYVAKLIRQYRHPDNIIQGAGGVVEILDNGNVFISWGVSEVSEFNRETEEEIMHAYIGTSEDAFTYRAHRLRWVGRPHWQPKVLPYLADCRASTVHVYVSWNGATEVRGWLIQTSHFGKVWTDAGIHMRTDFETLITLTCDDFPQDGLARCLSGFVMATALDRDGAPLDYGQSMATKVYIPRPRLIASGTCHDVGCKQGFTYNVTLNYADECPKAAGNSTLSQLSSTTSSSSGTYTIYNLMLAVVFGCCAGFLIAATAYAISNRLWMRPSQRWIAVPLEETQEDAHRQDEFGMMRINVGVGDTEARPYFTRHQTDDVVREPFEDSEDD